MTEKPSNQKQRSPCSLQAAIIVLFLPSPKCTHKEIPPVLSLPAKRKVALKMQLHLTAPPIFLFVVVCFCLFV